MYVTLNPHDVLNDETDEYYDTDLGEWRDIRGYTGQTAYELAHMFPLRRRVIAASGSVAQAKQKRVEVQHFCGRMRDVGEKCWWCGND